jgi:hypothetical protein
MLHGRAGCEVVEVLCFGLHCHSNLDLSQISMAVNLRLGCVMIDPAGLELLRCPTEASHSLLKPQAARFYS